MIHVKTYEGFDLKKPYREVDLQMLWDDHKFWHEIKDSGLFTPDPHSQTPLAPKVYFQDIIEPLLLNKEIEFGRAEHPYDEEIVNYGFYGRVKELSYNIHYSGGKMKIIVNLYDDNKVDLCAYTLTNIDLHKNFSSSSGKPKIIKIYNSEELEIEKELNLLRNANKYNL